MKKCAVYRTLCNYGGGLAFIPLEFEKDWLKLEAWLSTYWLSASKWEKLGEMMVDETVIKFRKQGKDANQNSPLHLKQIEVADYTYCE